jgi:hypothetical protein
MGWDNSRPVPWDRLIREWVIYAGLMSVVFLFFFRNDNMLGALAGVLISGPLYLTFGAVMAKFGYTRKRLKDLRAESRGASRADASGGSDSSEPTGTPRPRPAPTSRTSGGTGRPRSATKRKR